jgi:hypothetical protein
MERTPFGSREDPCRRRPPPTAHIAWCPHRPAAPTSWSRAPDRSSSCCTGSPSPGTPGATSCLLWQRPATARSPWTYAATDARPGPRRRTRTGCSSWWRTTSPWWRRWASRPPCSSGTTGARPSRRPPLWSGRTSSARWGCSACPTPRPAGRDRVRFSRGWGVTRSSTSPTSRSRAGPRRRSSPMCAAGSRVSTRPCRRTRGPRPTPISWPAAVCCATGSPPAGCRSG